MAITVADWWDQHVVGPAIIWLLVGLPSGLVVAAVAAVLGWQIDGSAAWVQFYWATVAWAAVLVGGTVLWRRFKRRRHTPEADRGRLTPVDIVFYGVALFLLGILAGPIYTVLADSAGSLGTGTELLFHMVFPAMILTIMTVVYLTGATGGTVK